MCLHFLHIYTFPVVSFPLPLIPTSQSVYIYYFAVPLFFFYALFPLSYSFIYTSSFHLRIHSKRDCDIVTCLFCSFLSLFHLFSFHSNTCIALPFLLVFPSYVPFSFTHFYFILLFSCHASPLQFGILCHFLRPQSLSLSSSSPILSQPFSLSPPFPYVCFFSFLSFLPHFPALSLPISHFIQYLLFTFPSYHLLPCSLYFLLISSPFLYFLYSDGAPFC